MTRTSEKAPVPRLRFKGCVGEWARQPIGELFSERDERSADGELLSVTIRHGVVRACDSGKTDSSSADKSHYKVVKIRDLAYNSMRMWQGACGASKYDGIVSPAYTVIVPNAESDSEFFEYTFKRPEVLRQFQRNSQGMTSDTWNLKFPLLKDICISCPRRNTQVRIATAFRNFDKLILMESSHLTSLRQLKRAMLVKMFPRPGQCVPEIRFKGFEGKWEEKCLGSSFDLRHESNADKSFTGILSVMKDVGVIRYTDKGNVGNKSKEDLSRYMIARADDVVLNSMNVIIGSVGVSHYDGCISPVYYALTPKAGTCSEFFGYWFWRKETQKLLASRACGMMEIRRKVSESDLLAISVLTPTLPEQRKIAAFFRNLDRLIGAAEKKVTKLRQVKASLLERMFV